MIEKVDISCVLGAVDETDSLVQTVETLISGNNILNNLEILIVLAPFATNETKQIANTLERNFTEVRLIHQLNKGIGGAYQQGFKNAKGEIVILMSSDLETDPHLVGPMVHIIQENQNIDIVTVSRWLEANSFSKYPLVAKILNYVFQKLAQKLFMSELSDFTYAFRAYRKNILQDIVWEESSHSFFLESLLKPLIKGARIQEIPGVWVKRSQGERHISISSYLHYVKILIRMKFSWS